MELQQLTDKELALRANQEGRWKQVPDPETGRTPIAFEPPPWFRTLDAQRQIKVLALIGKMVDIMQSRESAH